VNASSHPHPESRQALTAGIICYLIWGVIPLAFQQMGAHGADPWEILAHRSMWGVVWAAGLVILARQSSQILAVLRDPRTFGFLVLSSLVIATNWVTYILAVNNGRTLDAALGYYLNPLLNMAAGAWLFREKITRIGFVAIGLAVIGVVIQTIALGHAPWISLILACSFSLYGIIRKRVSADAQTGLFIECLILSVPALAWVIWIQLSGQGHFGQDWTTSLWLLFSGPLTVIPLMLFSWAARRMPLSTMGFLQYIAPTMVFVIGMIQGEPLSLLRGISFGFIWAAVAVFTAGAVHNARKKAAAITEFEPGLVTTPQERNPDNRPD